MKAYCENDKDSLPTILAPRELPEPKYLLADLREGIVSASWFQVQMRDNEDLRVCWWNGQSKDGRKHGTQDKPAAPFENAADHRVHLLLELMNERTAVRLKAAQSARITIKGRTLDDNKKAALLKQVVDYMLKTEMMGEMDDELEFVSNWSQNYGHSILYTGWQTEKQLEPRTIKVSDLQQARAAQSLAEEAAKLQALGQELNPEVEKLLAQGAYQETLDWLETDGGRLKLVALMMLIDEDLAGMGKQGQSEALRALNKLRRSQEATYHAPFLKKSCPKWEALQPMVDVFYPSETRKLSEARWIARVRWMTKVELLTWAEQEGLEDDWVREVLKHPGKCMDLTGLAEWVLSSGGTRLTAKTQNAWDRETTARHYQVVEVYWRAFTPFSVPVLYRTIAHGQVSSGFGKHEVMQAYHGSYPFHDLREEKWDKLLLSSRGVPELIGTAQGGVKAQWDSRTNTASMFTSPPMTGPAGSTPPPIGPNVYIEQPRGGQVEWLTPPPPDSRSIEIEQTILKRVDRLYGRISENVPETLQVLIQGMLSKNMLNMLKRALQMTVQLIQQYTPDLQGRRITGTDDYVSATRDEIQGLFDIEVEWDARDLSLDWIEQKLKFYTDLLIPLDNRGIIDRNAIILAAAESVDPVAAAKFVRTPQVANAQETDEEAAALSTIFSGGIPPFIADGVNHELRAQYMQSDLQQSPVRQQIMRMQPDIAKVWQNRLQKHLFQVQQEANKQAGIEGGSDPLNQSALAQLKAGGWQAMISPQQPGQQNFQQPGQVQAPAMAA
jgi:hypothetical protein